MRLTECYEEKSSDITGNDTVKKGSSKWGYNTVCAKLIWGVHNLSTYLLSAISIGTPGLNKNIKFE